MFKRLNLRPAVILLAIFLLSGCASTRLMKEGDELAGKGNWDEAVVKYREAYQDKAGELDFKIKYARARFEAALIHYRRGEEYQNAGNYDSALVEYQAALFLDPGLDKAKEAIKKTKMLMDSVYYYGKGLEYLNKGDEREAKASFKKALSLNPANKIAAAELEKLKKQQKLVMDGYELNLKSAEPITLEFRDTGVKNVFAVISKLSGMNFIFDTDVKDEKTTVFLKNATFQETLDLVLLTSKLSRKVVSDNTIIIYPSTPQKAAQYEELMIKVFYLTNSDAKKTANLLRTMTKAKDITVQDELNAVVVRANPDAITLAQKIIDATDLSDSEVMLEVTIMEINRNKATNLGIELSPAAITAAVPATNGTITLGDLGRLSSSQLLIGLPSAILNIKKEDLDAKILANPMLRVRNNGKAKIHIGERVPIITTTVNQGVTTENLQYQDVGLKFNLEPTIKQNDEVDLKLALEVSSLGTKTVTATGNIVYQIGTRNTETHLSLHDGETQVFGGLINDEERRTVTKIPLVGDIPVLGRLFLNVDDSNVNTDILLSITPHIIKKVEVPEETMTGFLSGREEYPSSKPLLESFKAESAEQGPGK